jgi:hypothetical protein
VAGSADGGACERWQEVQVWWPPARWRPGSEPFWWQAAQGGGDATRPGPCGRWQFAQPPAMAPCGPLARSRWQPVQAAARGLSCPLCCWWQLAHSACPAGAVRASSPWQLPQAGGLAGACGFAPWQRAQSRWPVFGSTAAAPPCREAWQRRHRAGSKRSVKPCCRWQSVQLAPRWNARSLFAAVWQELQARAAMRGASRAPWGGWQPVQASPRAAGGCAAAISWWQRRQLAAEAALTSCTGWQLLQSA